ncbi:unnamed protein product [Fusarium equiseti]|uniref:Uncharacterized protein n=1 Tax=Fusarium equiseti TaxID=61235 RepID=A0A8J2NEY7_FUSEQ|nr:unnamed protein product [Fusarium equiseti]
MATLFTSILIKPFLLPSTMVTTKTLPPETHVESDEKDLGRIGLYELVDLAEDTKDGDFVDDNDEPEKPEVPDGQTKFWVTRLLAIVPDVSPPIVKINIERFKSASQIMMQHTKEYADTTDSTELRVKELKAQALSVGFRSILQRLEISDCPWSFWGIYINIVTDSTGEVVGIYIGLSVVYRTFHAIPKCGQSEYYRLTTQPDNSASVM